MPKTFKNIPMFDRPREKILIKGIRALSNLELLMVILGRGIKNRDVAVLAKDILKEIEKDPENISIKKLQNIPGVGLAKASQIIASFEFARRYLINEGIKINNVESILQLVGDIRDKKQEHFITITLNGAAALIEKRIVFIGTINQSMIHPREVFADAISDRATAIIFVHNHPEDDTQPSQDDINITRRLYEAGKIVGIEVIDHIIINRDKYFSFQAEGLLPFQEESSEI